MNAGESSGGSRKILIRGVNWLGDAVMSLPAIQRLREARPNDSITVLTEDKLFELWAGHSPADDVIQFRKDENILKLARRLRGKRYDIAVIFPNSFRSALEVFLARIPVRIGYGGNLRGPMLTTVVRRRQNALTMRKRSAAEVRELIAGGKADPMLYGKEGHHLYHYLQLVRELGALSEPIAPQIAVSESEIRDFAQKFGLTEDRLRHAPIIGVNPGAEYGPAKRWPAEYFARACAEILRKRNAVILIFGGAGDRELATGIARAVSADGDKLSGSRVVDLAGKTSLAELCAGLALCSVVITNDTGPMHLAAAVGASVVAPFGSTSPELTGPGLTDDPRHTILRATVPCSPCFRRDCPIDLRCLRQIDPKEVGAAALAKVRDTPAGVA